MGSQPKPLAAVAPQQALPPLFTRKAASPYFSLTTFLMSTMSVLMVCPLLPAKLDDVLRFHRLVSSAAFRVEELQQLLKCCRVGRVAQKSAFAAYVHKFFMLQ